MKNRFFAYRSFWPELDTVRRFRDAGVNTLTFFPANTTNSLGEPYSKYQSNWLWFDTYDFTPVRQQIEDLLSANPDARLICMLDLNTPHWFVRKCAAEHIDSYDSLSCAIASPRWRMETEKYLKAILAYYEQNYSERILSYVLACGTTDEWMDSSDGIANREKNKAYSGIIPPRESLFRGSFNGFWRDPEKDREALKYWRFTGNLIASTIVHFAELVKNTVKRQFDLGVFYGYILELQGRRLVRCGHLAYEKVLSADAIDYFISPASYADRRIGGGCGFMIPEVTMCRFKKGYLQECDHRTHTYNRNLTPHVTVRYEPWPNARADKAGMRRAMVMSLINHTSLWWFDMWGGFYDDKTALENIALMHRLWEQCADKTYPMTAEIVMIVDPDSALYLNDECEDADIDKGLFIPIRTALSRIGTPFEIMSFGDISAVNDFARYKFVIFAGLFEVTPERKKILHEYVLKNDRVILWTDMTGVSDGNSASLTNMRNICGFDGQEEHNYRKMEGWTSVHVADAYTLKPAYLKKLAEQAGVNIICNDEVPVYANQRFVAVHTAKGGKRKLFLDKNVRKVVELFSNTVVAENCREFTYMFQEPETALFDLMPEVQG